MLSAQIDAHLDTLVNEQVVYKESLFVFLNCPKYIFKTCIRKLILVKILILFMVVLFICFLLSTQL